MTTLNSALIGVPGGRAKLQTPALVVDLDALERNITAMTAHAASDGVALRPHAKTHKCSAIAKLQLAAGAKGLCAAKLGEAEALAAAGIGALLLTSPVVTDAGIARLMALNARVPELMVTVDNPAIAARLADAAASSGKALHVLVDLDPGMSRTGIAPDERAVALVEQVARAPSLVWRGLQCYAGQVQHIEERVPRRERSLTVLKTVGGLRDTLIARGLVPEIISGGGTGTFDIDPEAGVLTELQVGSYIFMDREYRDVWEKEGGSVIFETSLFVQTTVISANREGLATTDAGLKSFATDAGVPRIASGAPDGASYFYFGDEQGGIVYPPTNHRLAPGDVVSCMVPHCDPTVNLYDVIHAVRGDTLQAIWPIEARGRSA